MKKGDTLVEVMLAVSVFGLMMVGAMAAMNASFARTMASMQMTMARNAMDSQAEALRYVNNEYIINPSDSHIWRGVIANSKESASDLSTCPTNQAEINGLNGFFINTSNSGGFVLRSGDGVITQAQTFPQIVDSRGNLSSQGLWVEAVREAGTVVDSADISKRPSYYDFHVRACWIAPGNDVPTTLGTIVRLYVPKSI